MNDASPARYAPARAFPSYAFLPGKDPHPTRHPEGHSFVEGEEPAASYRAPENWRSNEDYLFGVDLYNFGYLWEAHEAWEGIWLVSKHDKAQYLALQGLIQCSAAALKLRLEEPRGFAKLSSAGLARIDRVCEEAPMPFMGLDLARFAREFREFVASEPTDPEGRPRLELVFAS